MLRTLLVTLALAVSPLVVAPPSTAVVVPVEDYADYQPQTRCRPAAKPGTRELAGFIVARFGGSPGGISRACRIGGTSEHKEGRAFDWSLDATRRADRRRARAFLDHLFAEDRRGEPHARARRMGVMYVIWNDRMYAAWDRFEPERYLHAGCRSLRRCSKTLRHRDHLHVSLTRRAARGRTSWYAGRVG